MSRRVLAVLLVLAAAPGARASDDATQGEAPLRASVPVAAADASGSPVLFRTTEGGALNAANSALPVAADEGLWRQSRGLPVGSRIRMHLSDAKLPADGHSTVHLTITLLDANGRTVPGLTRVRIETSLGRLASPTGQQAQAFELAVPEGVAELDLVAPVTPGEARVRAASGAVRVQGRLAFVPELRPLIVVGLVEAGLSSQHVSADPNAPAVARGGFEDSLQHWGNPPASGSFFGASGRAAGFVKGTLGSDVLLTGAFDSNKLSVPRFFSDVDPNQYFPVAGDSSLINYDARSSSKLYLRLDRGPSHLQYGDFQSLAPADTAWLGSYARTLTGLTGHYESPAGKASVFAAFASAHQFVDEQPGRGLSGPYAVSQANAIANSETVERLVRDRNQPAIVLSREVLTRYADYDFEPFSGRIVFRQPVPSVDENLNPVSIRITYEVDGGGPRYWVDGANGEFALGDRVIVGGRYAEDRNPAASFRLYGADGIWHVDATTTLTVDVARSEGDQLYASTVGGGLTPAAGAAGLGAIDPAGNAYRIEIHRQDEALDARLYAARADRGFRNANADLAPGGSRDGLHATYRLSESTVLTADALHSTDETTDARRTGATLGVEARAWTGAKLETGLAYVDQTYNAALPAVAQFSVGAVPGTAAGAPLNNTGFGFAGTGLLGNPLVGALGLPASGAEALVEQNYLAAQAKLTQRITDRASAYAQYEHTIDATSGQLAAVGGEYRIADNQRLYARYEDINSLTGVYGLGDGSRAHQAAVGLDTAYMRDGTLYNEYRIAGTASAQAAADALGVRNIWRLSPGLAATTSVERQEVVNPAPLTRLPGGLLAGVQSATAVAVGLDYSGSPVWKTAERVEYRRSELQTNWLSTIAVLRKLSDDWSLIARNVFLNASTTAAGQPPLAQNEDRAQLGLAYRDIRTNVWNVLARYEYRRDYDSTPLTGSDTRTQIASVVANCHPNRAWELEGQLAGKLARGTLDGAASNFDAALIAARAVRDLGSRWDVGLLASTTSGGGTRDQGVAIEAGYRVLDNLWVSAGAIAGRYADAELFGANSSWRGVYARMRFKFDEGTFRAADPETNRTLDAAANAVRR